jgi:hypothetical protein
LNASPSLRVHCGRHDGIHPVVLARWFSRRNSRMDISSVYACVVALMEVQKMPAEMDTPQIW